jgi:hypothetical protein
MILPTRHFVYPGQVDEVELGALEVLVQPGEAAEQTSAVPALQPFLATCALGFRDPAAPTGIWAMPDPDWLCAVSGGYAYLVNVADPQQFTMLRYRPVLEVRPYLPEDPQAVPGGLLLFIGHNSLLAWGRDGEAWESDKLSWEGVTIDRIDGSTLFGHGWDMRTDKDLPFALDLASGKRIEI